MGGAEWAQDNFVASRVRMAAHDHQEFAPRTLMGEAANLEAVVARVVLDVVALARISGGIHDDLPELHAGRAGKLAMRIGGIMRR